MMNLDNLPDAWRDEILRKARSDMIRSEKMLSRLQNKATGYYRAHEVAATLYRAAYSAMLGIPAPHKTESLAEDQPAAVRPTRHHSPWKPWPAE
jgi:hypothetical protein